MTSVRKVTWRPRKVKPGPWFNPGGAGKSSPVTGPFFNPTGAGTSSPSVYPGGMSPGPGGFQPVNPPASVYPGGVSPGPGGLQVGSPLANQLAAKKASGQPLSLEDLRKMAIADVTAAYKPIQDYYQSQIDQANKAAQAKADFVRQLWKEYADYVKSAAPAIQSIFQNAGADQASYAKGFSGSMQNSLSNDAAAQNAQLAAAGTPSSQLLGNKEGAASTLYATGGYIPATSFSEQGAGWAAAAARLPDISMLYGIQASGQALNEGTANAKQWQDQIALLAAKEPGDIQAALHAYQTQQQDQANFNTSQKNARDRFNANRVDKRYAIDSVYDAKIAKINADAAARSAAAKTDVEKFNIDQKRRSDEFNATLAWQQRKFQQQRADAGLKPRPGEGVVDRFASLNNPNHVMTDKYGNVIFDQNHQPIPVSVVPQKPTEKVVAKVVTTKGVALVVFDPATGKTRVIFSKVPGMVQKPQPGPGGAGGGQVTPAQQRAAIARQKATANSTRIQMGREANKYARGGRSWGAAYDALLQDHRDTPGLTLAQVDRMIRQVLSARGYRTPNRTSPSVYWKKPKKKTTETTKMFPKRKKK